MFSSLSAKETGIGFVNRLTGTDFSNILDCLYYYNGAGVAIADLNNDGLADVNFTSNQESNKLYLNKGNLPGGQAGFKFEDITDKAGVQGKGNWKTGVTIADVNADGLLDIYLCDVGKYKNFNGRIELFINNGNLTFTERKKSMAWMQKALTHNQSFLIMIMMATLDMFLVNHSVHSTDTYVRSDARRVKNEVNSDKLFRNDGKHFTEVTEQADIYSSIIGYELNVSVGDLNNDGWDDFYVTSDFMRMITIM